MDPLPVEIVREIVLLAIEGPDDATHRRYVAQLAAINRVFQEIIEDVTFADLHLTVTRIPEAAVVLYRYDHRIKCVKSITYDAHVYASDIMLGHALESPLNSLPPHYYIDILFNLLAWLQQHTEQHPASDRGIALFIKASRPRFAPYRAHELQRPRDWVVKHILPPEAFFELHRRMLSQRNFDDLRPKFDFLSKLTLDQNSMAQYMNPEAMNYIVPFFKDLKTIEWIFTECERYGPQFRRDLRSGKFLISSPNSDHIF